MSFVNWEFIGAQLLERERRPVLVLDLAGRVMKANRAFLFLLPDGTRTQQVSLRDEWLHPDSRAGFDGALTRVAQGERAQVTVTLTNTLFPLDLVLELMRLGPDDAPLVMAVMIDAVSRGPALPLRPAVGVTYEVLASSAAPRRVTRAVSSHAASGPAGADDTPCWKRIFDRDDECPVCPVRVLGDAPRATVVARGDGGQGHLTALVAERRGDHAVVTTFPVEPETYSALLNARVEALAEAAQLSPREREVLWLLVIGRSLDEVATVTGITERTAKFHQQNLLKKLGADSRIDLFRLLL